MNQPTPEEIEQLIHAIERSPEGEGVSDRTDKQLRSELELARLLQQARFSPAPEFTNRLYIHLTEGRSHRLAARGSRLPSSRRLAVFGLLAAGLAALLLVNGSILFLPQLRAYAQAVAARFAEVDTPWALLPGAKDQVVEPLPEGDLPGSNEPGQASALPNAPPTGLLGETASLGRELVSLETAQAGVDFAIRLPAYLPEGYSLRGVLPTPALPAVPAAPDQPPSAGEALPAPPQVVTLIFGGPNGELLSLSEWYGPGGLPGEARLPVGTGSLQELAVDGQPAQFVTGRWSEGSWLPDGHYQLHWQGTNGVQYDLISLTLGLEELLPIAESIQ